MRTPVADGIEAALDVKEGNLFAVYSDQQGFTLLEIRRVADEMSLDVH